MSNNATKQDIDEVQSVLRDFMQQVDNRFTGLEQNENQFNLKFDRFVSTIDGFIGRIDKYEIEPAARDYQFEKLLAWAKKVSEQTGIPLESL